VATAEALGDRSRGERLAASMQQRLHAVSRSVVEFPDRLTVACLEWLDPLMSAGNWVPELVEIAGGRAVLGVAGKHSPYMTWEQLLDADPDVIVILPCGFDIPRTTAELHLLVRSPHWPQLSAVRNHRVYITDGNQYFNRPGPRVVESAEILAEILHLKRDHPDALRHHGSGWVRLGEALGGALARR
jgi:iron complex transport system substrate-binding protein